MGGQSSKKTSYEDECRLDPDMQSFDATLQDRTNRAINTIASGVEVRALSLDSLKEVTGCLLEMNQEVFKIILECKQDVWKNQNLFHLVEEYFGNSLQTLKFYRALEKCLNGVRDGQLIINNAVQQFEKEDAEGANEKKYVRTLEELEKFKTAGDPLTEEFFQIFTSVYKHQSLMLEKLQNKNSELDKKLKSVKAWRKVSSIIFATIFAAVLIWSIVAAAMAHQHVAAALADATLSTPLGSMGKWIDSLWKKYEDALKGEKDVIQSMQAGTSVAIKELDGIKDLVDRLKIEIKSLLRNADFALQEEEGVKLGIEEIKKKLRVFTENIEDLNEHAHRCSRDIRWARTVVMERIKPNN